MVQKYSLKSRFGPKGRVQDDAKILELALTEVGRLAVGPGVHFWRSAGSQM